MTGRTSSPDGDPAAAALTEDVTRPVQRMLARGAPMASGLEIELASEVFQAAVDLDGDHAVGRAEQAGDADGGGEVGAG